MTKHFDAGIVEALARHLFEREFTGWDRSASDRFREQFRNEARLALDLVAPLIIARASKAEGE